MEMLAATVVLVTLMLSLINLAVTVYVSQTKLSLAQLALSRSRLVADTRANLLTLGAVGRFYALSTTALALMIPKIFAKRNLVDLNEVKALPKNLRLWIVLPVATSWILLATLVIAGSFLSTE